MFIQLNSKTTGINTDNFHSRDHTTVFDFLMTSKQNSAPAPIISNKTPFFIILKLTLLTSTLMILGAPVV